MDPVLVIVGELNPYGHEPRYALHDLPVNAAGHRLRTKVLGLGRLPYFRIPRFNLCTGKWAARDAAAEATRLQALHPEATFLLLGRKVATAFGLRDAELFSTVGKFVVIPHPSGRCREWNDPAAFQRARDLVSPYLPAERES